MSIKQYHWSLTQRVYAVKRPYILIVLLLFCSIGLSQELNKLSLFEAYDLLEENYPQLKNADLLEIIHESEIEKIEKSRLPSIYLKADTRLQSENLKTPSEPGSPNPFEFALPLYSINGYVEAKYLLLDGGMHKAQKELKNVELELNKQSLEVDRNDLRSRINNLFLQITLIRQNQKLLHLTLDNIVSRKESARAGVELGTLLESDYIKIEVKELELESELEHLGHLLSGHLETLSVLTGTNLSHDIELSFPNLPNPTEIPTLDRPEQSLFELQRQTILTQSEMTDAARRPTLSAYGRAGLGYPNPLNAFDVNAAPYGLIGLQFNWLITDWKQHELDKKILSLKAQQIQHTRETFEFNIESKESAYIEQINRLQNLIQRDQKIADLQAMILKQMNAQLDEGVITSTEYLTQVNEELYARQNLLIHQTEQLSTQIQFWNERGGFEH